VPAFTSAARSSASLPPVWFDDGAGWLKIKVAKNGIYTVTRDSLAQAGVPTWEAAGFLGKRQRQPSQLGELRPVLLVQAVSDALLMSHIFERIGVGDELAGAVDQHLLHFGIVEVHGACSVFVMDRRQRPKAAFAMMFR